MRQNITDKDFVPIKMNRRNQPVLVSANVENNQITNFVCAGKCASQLIEVFVIVCPHDLEPA